MIQQNSPLGGADLGTLQQQINDLDQKIERLIRDHYHDGTTATRLDFSDLIGLFEVVSSVPTHTPRDLFDQIKIYTSGSTYRLYWYDTNAHTWHYASGT